MNKKLAFFLVAFFIMGQTFCEIRLPKIFGTGMVLQRDKDMKIWGWAARGESVSIRFRQQQRQVTADENGLWYVVLKPEKAGGPDILTVEGKNKIVLEDVLVGDVWLCSGQSNMEWTVGQSANATVEIASANFPNIRNFKVSNAVSANPLDDLMDAGEWKVANNQHVGQFTAVGYFFARELYRELQVPIGIVNSSWGGTDIETWTSLTALQQAGIVDAKFTSSFSFEERVSQMKKIKESNIETIQQQQGGLPDASELARLKGADYDDSTWPEMKVPGLWQGPLGTLDGIVWMRKTLQISSEDAGQEALLLLAAIDDMDDTYVNGVRVGGTKSYNEPRAYKIPSGVLKEGTNVIAVRIEDSYGNGGIYGRPDDVGLHIGDKIIPLASEWKYKVERLFDSKIDIGPNSYPSLLYNAMIFPLLPMSIKGFLWYQGENNAPRAHQYQTAFPLMITDWRTHFAQGALPFYFVQLASYQAGGGVSNEGSQWAELREAQTKALDLSNTGMAVTIDIGESKDIHPKNKQDVGLRLAKLALKNTYGKKVVDKGPILDKVKISGNTVTLTFKNTDGGLKVKGLELNGFELAGANQKFYPAKAVISGNKVVLTAAEVSVPVSVHYAWADDAGAANLFNTSGLPAEPFRTDNWPEITKTEKYTIR
ncbi:sialate O-acetylesterase [Olivibacter sitiensis]|uniref:sialate O-acetylesterase n=1 Tax=Olivibacter sitiensis TaxID=376470 RepID=UPI00040D7690|nr:sialate O-acetylesterase [Olivibacter sitiensis]